MEKRYFADIVVNEEKLSNEEPIFVAHCTNLGISSQGDSTEGAINNIKEAIELYLEEQPEGYEELEVKKNPSMFSIIEVKRNAKAANSVR